MSTSLPSDYQSGYEEAKKLDAELADVYAAHTIIGDPVAEAAMEALAEYEPKRQQELIRAGIDDDRETFKEAPAALKELFELVSNPPPHIAFDPEKALPGSRVFYANSDMFMLGLALESLTGLSEGLAKSFYVTGRAVGNLRRFRQNTRHIIEITLPGGLDRNGEGWKLSVRIRIIHAQMRRLLAKSGEWNIPAEGVPLHMAHMAMASTGFSALNLQAARKLGVRMTEAEAEGFMHIWHYVAWLFGVPDPLLKYVNSESSAMYMRKIALACECPAGPMAVEIAKGYIGAIPDILDIKEEEERKKLTRLVFRVGRALVGKERADALEFPKCSTFGVLALLNAHRKIKTTYTRLIKKEGPFRSDNFYSLLQQAVYDDCGISYRLPDAVKEGVSSSW